MEYEKYLMRGTPVAEFPRTRGIPCIFVDSPHQREHEIGSYLGGLLKKILPYLNKGVVSKETLRVRINVIEDVENNKH